MYKQSLAKYEFGKFLNILVIVLFIPLFYYVLLPNPEFPAPLPDSVQSDQPADVEDSLRRGYYTNLSRAEVINHYEKEFNRGFNFYASRLNYPPEDAPVLIRDQTKSTFLEEIVHPFRESLYINGFEPKTEEYAQELHGVRFNQKITVRYVPSQLSIRILILYLALMATLFLIREYKYAKNN